MKTLFVLLIGFLLSSFGNETGKSGYDVGDFATDFNLKNVDGKMVSMADYSNAKGFIIAFTCNTCPYAVMYEDRIIALHNKYDSKGYPVIAINPNDPARNSMESFDEMKKRAKDKNFTFPYLVDETQDITKSYGATNTPHVYMLNKENGKYQVAYIGAIDNNAKDASKASRKYVEEAIDSIITGGKIKDPRTKAVGCTIKWKQI
ncbi:thioredoxin family protein [Bacteroidota bacterium]